MNPFEQQGGTSIHYHIQAGFKQVELNAGLESESNGNDEEPLLITTIDEVDDPSDDLCTEALPPPLDSGDDKTPNHSARGSKLKITPSFLQSLEPPREFSDSGFPDTDHDTAAHSTPEQGYTKHMHSYTPPLLFLKTLPWPLRDSKPYSRIVLTFLLLSQFQLALFFETETTIDGLKQAKILCGVATLIWFPQFLISLLCSEWEEWLHYSQ